MATPHRGGAWAGPGWPRLFAVAHGRGPDGRAARALGRSCSCRRPRLRGLSASSSRDLGSAAMSAADEVDGQGVARPHYGCECGAGEVQGSGGGERWSALAASEGVGLDGGCAGRGHPEELARRTARPPEPASPWWAPRWQGRTSEALPPRLDWGPHPTPPVARLDRDWEPAWVRWQPGAGRVPGARKNVLPLVLPGDVAESSPPARPGLSEGCGPWATRFSLHGLRVLSSGFQKRARLQP